MSNVQSNKQFRYGQNIWLSCVIFHAKCSVGSLSQIFLPRLRSFPLEMFRDVVYSNREPVKMYYDGRCTTEKSHRDRSQEEKAEHADCRRVSANCRHICSWLSVKLTLRDAIWIWPRFTKRKYFDEREGLSGIALHVIIFTWCVLHSRFLLHKGTNSSMIISQKTFEECLQFGVIFSSTCITITRQRYHNIHKRLRASIDLSNVEVDPVVGEVLVEEKRFPRLRRRLCDFVVLPWPLSIRTGLKQEGRDF